MMKYPLFLLLILPAISNGQPSDSRKSGIAFEYSDVQTGSNVSLIYRRYLKKTFIAYAGVKYLTKSRKFEDNFTEAYVYRKQFRPDNFSQHFGLKLGIEKAFHIKGTNLHLLGFYDFQFTRAHIDSKTFIYVDFDSTRVSEINNGYSYMIERFRHGPINCFENHVGIAARLAVTNSLYFRIQGGQESHSTEARVSTQNTTRRKIPTGVRPPLCGPWG